MDEHIRVRSTSWTTADATPIILENTDMKRLRFIPKLIDNPHDRSKSVEGKFVYEKKRKHDSRFPSDLENASEFEKITRGSLKVGDWMEMDIDSTQTQMLVHGLQEYYNLYEDIGAVPMGENSYTRVDRNLRTLLEVVRQDPDVIRQLGNEESLDLVRTLLKIIISAESTDDVRDVLSSLEQEGLDKLNNAVSIDKLLRVKTMYESNLNNGDEEFWQNLLKNDQWILAQLFGRPMTIFQDKAYVGGKNITNTNGHICDFIYQNSLSKNVALIEIKTPQTRLVGREYRNGVYPASDSLSGATTQVLTYKDSLLKEYNNLCNEGEFRAINPLCVVIIGQISSLTPQEKNSFELFRDSLSGVLVITYDELLSKVNDLIDILNS